MNGPSIRKPLGVLFILGIVAVWAGLVMAATPWIAPMPWPVQAVVYLLAGVLWIVPLGPVLKWMEGGR